MTGDATVGIDYDKVARDERLDGYKGYTTNSTLTDDRVIEEYGYLFMIERAFRLCKTDLDIRPMYHRLLNRIEAHVCICFVAYTVLLELERVLKAAGSGISPWTGPASSRRKYIRSITSIHTTTSESQCSCTPKRSQKSPSCLTSSRPTAKMGVPLRKTGNTRRSPSC